MKIEYMQKMLISRLEELNGVYSSEFITEMKNNILNEDDIDKLRELDGFATDRVYLQYLRDNIQKKIGSPSLSIFELKNYINFNGDGGNDSDLGDNLENNIPDRVGILNKVSESIVYSGEDNATKSSTSGKLEFEESSLEFEDNSIEFEDDDSEDDGIEIDYSSEEEDDGIEFEDDDSEDGIDIEEDDDDSDEFDEDDYGEEEDDSSEDDDSEDEDVIDIDFEEDEDDLGESEYDSDEEDDDDLDEYEEDEDDSDSEDDDSDNVDIDFDEEEDDFDSDDDSDEDDDDIEIEEEDDDDFEDDDSDDEDEYLDSLLGNHSSEDDDLYEELNNIVRGNNTRNNSNQNSNKPANSHKEKVFNNDFSNNTWDILNGAIDGVSKILRKL